MINYSNKLQAIIDSISTFTFELDIEELKKEMQLKVVPKEVLERIGNEQVSKNFHSGKFLIKMSNGDIHDFKSIAKYISENNIPQPLSFNPDEYKFVELVLKKDFMSCQINKFIKKQLSNSTEIDLAEMRKSLIIEDAKNKKSSISIDDMPIKESKFIKEGKFYIQSSCSKEVALSKINDVIVELKDNMENYIKDRFIKDYKHIIFYFLLILVIVAVWMLSNNIIDLVNSNWQNILSLAFSILLVIVGLIKYNFMEALFSKDKARIRYEKEFWETASQA